MTCLSYRAIRENYTTLRGSFYVEKYKTSGPLFFLQIAFAIAVLTSSLRVGGRYFSVCCVGGCHLVCRWWCLIADVAGRFCTGCCLGCRLWCCWRCLIAELAGRCCGGCRLGCCWRCLIAELAGRFCAFAQGVASGVACGVAGGA